jgi:hypothetical protein
MFFCVRKDILTFLLHYFLLILDTIYRIMLMTAITKFLIDSHLRFENYSSL